jgi:hypothetical protein
VECLLVIAPRKELLLAEVSQPPPLLGVAAGLVPGQTLHSNGLSLEANLSSPPVGEEHAFHVPD